MTGWLILLAMFGTTLAFLFTLKLRGPTLTLAAAALVFGAAGFALQGRPGLPGTTRSVADAAPPLVLTGARHALFGTFTPAERWLIIADSYARSGDTMGAADLLRSAIRQHPRDPELWTGYANALVDHAHMLTPAARLAFGRATALSPDTPGPRFFLGLALLRSGDRAGAIEQWSAILAAAPPTASWRSMVEGGIALATGGAL